MCAYVRMYSIPNNQHKHCMIQTHMCDHINKYLHFDLTLDPGPCSAGKIIKCTNWHGEPKSVA